jgi:hypothetical protein
LKGAFNKSLRGDGWIDDQPREEPSIVYGYGRNGRALTRDLMRKIPDIVIIDKDPNLVTTMKEDGILYLVSDAAQDAAPQSNPYFWISPSAKNGRIF